MPPSTELAPGFAMAKRQIDVGASVRLVGVGVTLPRSWPPWAGETSGLWLSELTAYRATTRWQATRPLRRSLRALTDELFDGALPDLRGSEVFYPHIGLRAFASLAFVMPTALGLAQHHACDVVTCTRPEWPGFGLYRALAGLSPKGGSRARWAARVVALAAAGWAASLLHTVVTYSRSLVGVRETRRLDRLEPARLWVQLFPQFRRSNEALIEATKDRPVGALLHGHLGRGEADESRLTSRRGSELWPGLRGLQRESVVAWASTSIPASLLDFARSCAAFTKNCAISARRLCLHGPLLELGASHIDMNAHLPDLVKLLTIDMARVCMADVATIDAIRNHDFVGATVVSAGAQPSDVAVAVRRLRRAGATTVDFAHGWSGEPAPFTDEPPCDYRCVWVPTDVGYGEVRFLVGGMLVPPRLPRAGKRAPVHVLLMSNYLHRDDRVYQTGLDGYQDELLDVIRRRSARYAFRWRPHPADMPDLVTRSAAGLQAEVSRGRPLAEDFAWADVVVSTVSTATLQALLLDLPVLVHITPDVEGLPVAAPFAPERTFFLARDGVEKLDAVVVALFDPNVLAPEQRMREALFGPDRTSRTLAEAIASVMTSRSSPRSAARRA